MTLTLHIQPSWPFHYARGRSVGPCAFTANRLGYQTLLKWARGVAGDEPLIFALPSLSGFGGVVARWLRGQGQAVVIG